ncbi:methyltransferase domain-containing protein [Phytoactinopolyspora alkaliphila]|uniref:methyltransferase domain-containing protein n=1 Tax=Phytoactinopolyspora alkaliphila TaxID=1783498 RepID=UPI001C20AD33|nr:class I SAM-dependent methyltransferase [Phytoactinopolyspora alkaliphila]
MLPPTLQGKDVIELGCGTAYVSAWMARRGARPVGLDNSAEQLATTAQDLIDGGFHRHHWRIVRAQTHRTIHR